MLETEVDVKIITKNVISAEQIRDLLKSDFLELNCSDRPEYKYERIKVVDCKGLIASAQSPKELEDGWDAIIMDDLLKGTNFDVIQDVNIKIPATGYSLSHTVGMEL